MPAPVLTTPRLELRPVRQSDARRLRFLIDDYEVAQWLTAVPHPYARADAQAFIAHAANLAGEVWAITDSDGIQGMIGVEDDFGYWLGRPAWGQGYVTEAGRAVTTAWFADAQATDLASSYFVGNARSRRVLEKLGFVDTGPATHHSKSQGCAVDTRGMNLPRARWRLYVEA